MIRPGFVPTLCLQLYYKQYLKDKSAAKVCRQVPDMFCNFYLVKKDQIFLEFYGRLTKF